MTFWHTVIVMYQDAVRSLRDNFGRDRARFLWPCVGFLVTSATFSTLLGIISGLDREVTAQFRHLGVNSVMVTTRPATALRDRPPVPLTLSDYDNLRRKLPESMIVAPLLTISGMARACGRSRIASIVGTSAEWEPMAAPVLAEGRFLRPTDEGLGSCVCVLGSRVAADLGCARVGSDILVSGRPCEIVGILGSARTYDVLDHSDAVFVPVSRLRSAGDLPPAVLLVQTADPRDAAVLRDIVTLDLRTVHHLRDGDEDDFEIREQSDLLEGYQTVFRAIRGLAIAVAALLALLTVVTLISSLNAGIRERIREIGLLRCVGAPRGYIRAEVITEGIVVALAGTIAGQLLSVLAGAVLYASGAVPFAFSFVTVLTCTGFLIVTGSGAAAWPAYCAGALSPWDCLRTE